MATDTKTHDVAILGAGLAGTVLASVLARNGADVILIDAGSHPRFAIGESTIPYTSTMMRLVADRFDVPEVKHLATFEAVRKHITTACGIKRNFGFVYHREGEAQDPRQTNQFIIPKALHTENHFFRQHLDAYMLNVAVRYGAHVRQQTRVEHIDIDDRGVTLGSERGHEFKARYLVDASGHASPLARKFELREDPTRFRHHSRSLFTHMIGVRPYDEVVAGRPGTEVPSRWCQGTLHHIFEGGWMWVIPFDNHARATNPLCSVGLNLDPRLYPKPDVDPETEFRTFIQRFPVVADQFRDATAVRNWVSTGRLQYSSSATVGDRYCLTSHAAGFLDALFSRGLTNTLEIINALAPRLLDAIRDGDFSRERFKYVEELEQGLLAFNDDLVDSAYTSFKDFHMWNATFRIWGLGAVIGTFVLQQTLGQFAKTGDQRVFTRLEETRQHGFAVPLESEFDPLMGWVAAECRKVADEGAEPVATGDRIFARLADADFIPPAFGFADPEQRFYHATLPRMLSTIRWARDGAPSDVGSLVQDALQSFMRHRLKRGEFYPGEELRGLLRPGMRSKLLESPQ